MDLSDSLDIAKQSGTRGGLEQFSWDSLRSIPRKEREHYLGHSLHYNRSRGKGRFSRNDWHSKVHKSTSSQSGSSELQIERERIISKEQKIMNKLLGIQEDTHYGEKMDGQGFGPGKDPNYNSGLAEELHQTGRARGGNRRMLNASNREICKGRRRTKRRSFSRSLSV